MSPLPLINTMDPRLYYGRTRAIQMVKIKNGRIQFPEDFRNLVIMSTINFPAHCSYNTLIPMCKCISVITDYCIVNK